MPIILRSIPGLVAISPGDLVVNIMFLLISLFMRFPIGWELSFQSSVLVVKSSGC